MPRQSQIVIPLRPHHITQQRNRRMDIFDESKNYRKDCELINEYEYADAYSGEIIAYYLLSVALNCSKPS